MIDMTTGKVIRSIGKGIGVLAFAFLAVVVFWNWLGYFVMKPEMLIAHAPTGSEAAFLVMQGFGAGRDMAFFVSPDGTRKHVQRVGTVTADDTLSFTDIQWSRDGTVVATRSWVLSWREVPWRENQKLSPIFTHGFDFLKTERYVPALDVLDESDEKWRERNRKLKNLLVQRGGAIEVESRDDPLRRMSWFQWKAWQRQVAPRHTPVAKPLQDSVVPPNPQR